MIQIEHSAKLEHSANLQTKRQAASTLGVSLGTIDKWIKTKRIPYVKLGYAVRFIPADLQQFIAERRVA